jgi:Protein of unknown function (DUF433)
MVRTRVPVWLLVRARQLGTTQAELLRSYPSLRAEDLANAWAYYRGYRRSEDFDDAEREAAPYLLWNLEWQNVKGAIQTWLREFTYQ